MLTNKALYMSADYFDIFSINIKASVFRYFQKILFEALPAHFKHFIESQRCTHTIMIQPKYQTHCFVFVAFFHCSQTGSYFYS